MWLYVALYCVIGIIVSLVNNHFYTKLQTKEQKENENSGMLIALIMWAVFWPIGIINAIYFTKIMLTNKN